MLWRLIKFLFVIAILGGILFVVYAYLGPIFMPDDFAAPAGPASQPITLEVN